MPAPRGRSADGTVPGLPRGRRRGRIQPLGMPEPSRHRGQRRHLRTAGNRRPCRHRTGDDPAHRTPRRVPRVTITSSTPARSPPTTSRSRRLRRCRERRHRARRASTGSFTSDCGRNADGHRNSDNFITAPGRLQRRAPRPRLRRQHFHRPHSTDASLAAAGTTCRRGDRSVYFWPVLRDIRTRPGRRPPGGGQDGNLGHILTPAAVSLDFLGNPRHRSRPMPRFLRIVTGDAKAVTTGPGATPGRGGPAPAPRAGPAPRTTRCAPPASSSSGSASSPAAGTAPDIDSETTAPT